MPLSAKQSAKQLIDHLPDQATWDDIMYELYVKQKIEVGLQAAKEGRTIPQDQVKARILAKRQTTNPCEDRVDGTSRG